MIRQFYDESRTFRVIGQNGSILYLSVNNQGLKTKQGAGTDESRHYRKAIFDIKIIPRKKNAFDTEQHNLLIKELFNAGAFTPERASSAIIALEAMMLENKDSIIQSLKQLIH